MWLQKSSLFGLYAVLELAATPDRRLATADIAATYGISSHHLAKVMRTLVRAGLIESVRGAGGGYRFAGNAARVTLFDVIQLFESLEPEVDSSLVSAVRETPVGAALQAVNVEINEASLAILRSITLKSLLKHASGARP